MRIIDDPEHWRCRAQETRAVAEKLDDPEARKIMIEIALSYEQLAMLAELRAMETK